MFQIGDEVLYMSEDKPSNNYKGVIREVGYGRVKVHFIGTDNHPGLAGHDFGIFWYPNSNIVKGNLKEKTIQEQVLDKIKLLDARFSAKTLSKRKVTVLPLP